MIPLEISSTSHVLLKPNLHDGNLLAITVMPNSRIDLTVSTSDGRKFLIVLDGVVEFNAKGFRNGNIILDITILRGNEVRSGDLDGLKHEGMDLIRSAEFLNNIVDKIVQGSLYVIQLNPSYGCELVCACKLLWIEGGWHR